jgi:prepilin-type processing-associated H-X9-DG protein
LVRENQGTGGGGAATSTPGAPGDYAGNGGSLRNPPNNAPYLEPRFWRPEKSRAGCDVTGPEPDLDGVIMAAFNYCSGPQPNWSSDMTLDRIPDGLSKTFLAGEKHVYHGTLERQGSLYNGDNGNNSSRGAGTQLPLARTATDSAYCVDPTTGGVTCPKCSCDNFGSWHNGTVQFVFCDGHVESISTSINGGTLTNFASRWDGR